MQRNDLVEFKLETAAGLQYLEVHLVSDDMKSDG